MKNIEKFIQDLQECMLANQSDYIDSIINTLIENESNYRSVAFNRTFYKYPNNYFDLNFAIDSLLKARNEKNFMFFLGQGFISGSFVIHLYKVNKKWNGGQKLILINL